MRIALTKNTLRVPPTYFALSHAEKLQTQHDFRMFTLAADVRETNLSVPIQDFVPLRSLPFRQRELVIPLFMRTMARSIRGYNPDVIHQHFATWSKPAVSASVAGGIPLVTTLHGVDVMMALRSPRTAMERWHHHNIGLAQGQSRRFLAVSGYLASLAVTAGFDASRVEVHYQGIDTDFFTPASGPIDPGGRPVVTFVGAVSERKGVRDLLHASIELAKQMEHDLVFIGSGPLDVEMRREAEGHPHVHFAGNLDRIGIRDRLRSSTVVVLPTQEYQGWREAAGLVLLESQACGTPVIAYDSGGTSEMLDPDSSGLLVPEKDVVGLQSALSDVLTLAPTEYQRMRQSARRFSEDKRSLTRSCVELVEHYEAVTA